MSSPRLTIQSLPCSWLRISELSISFAEPGSAGEVFAQKLLKKNLYSIWDKNWRTATGELDIIAQHGRTLHFNEVKTRRQRRENTTGDPFSAEAAVDIRKTARLRLLANIYLYRNQKRLRRHRIDQYQFNIIALTYERIGFFYRFQVEIYKNAFPFSPEH